MYNLTSSIGCAVCAVPEPNWWKLKEKLIE